MSPASEPSLESSYSLLCPSTPPARCPSVRPPVQPGVLQAEPRSSGIAMLHVSGALGFPKAGLAGKPALPARKRAPRKKRHKGRGCPGTLPLTGKALFSVSLGALDGVGRNMVQEQRTASSFQGGGGWREKKRG